jgi:hypothetical protein
MWPSSPFGAFLSASNNVMPAQGGGAVTARHRYGLEVEHERHLKNFIVIFLFIEVFCTFRYLISKPFFRKKKLQKKKVMRKSFNPRPHLRYRNQSS